MSPIITPGGGGGGGSQPIQSVTAHVSSADILALHTSPKQIVAAPGSGKVLLPFAGVIVYTFGTTPYVTGGGNRNIQLTTPAGAADGFASLLELNGAHFFLTGSADAVSAWAPNNNADISSGFGGDWTLAKWEDAPMVFYLSDADPTNGNGTIDMVVKYLILDLP